MPDKELFLLHSAIRSPPFSEKAQDETGYLLRRLQQGETLVMPHSRPMPIIGARCHELRVRDQDFYWRVIYRMDADVILVADVFPKKTGTTPANIIAACRRRFAAYDKVQS